MFDLQECWAFCSYTSKLGILLGKDGKLCLCIYGEQGGLPYALCSPAQSKSDHSNRQIHFTASRRHLLCALIENISASCVRNECALA